MKRELIKKITDIVGKEKILTSDEDRICYSYDATGKTWSERSESLGMPDIVVKPKMTDEISAIIKIANEENIPVVPRGAGSGFVGGSIPVKGGIALVMTDMNRLIEIDEENMIAISEPGEGFFQNHQQGGKEKRIFYYLPPNP